MDKNIKDDILKRFGQQLKKDREKKRISSAELARIAFINKPITNLEKWGTNPTLTTLIKLADALDLEVHEQRFEDIDVEEASYPFFQNTAIALSRMSSSSNILGLPGIALFVSEVNISFCTDQSKISSEFLVWVLSFFQRLKTNGSLLTNKKSPEAQKLPGTQSKT